MAPTNKARAAGVSASSFFDLKAELAKHEEAFAREKAAAASAAGGSALVGGVKRPDKVRSRAGRELARLPSFPPPISLYSSPTDH